ncbi:hypothetical protein P8X24_01910 [Pyrococcus kukulkanii]|uniref:hypothetical protein n=1 Tax=Pyrococcus kukulkanii TaxID=1609559 RepID=UPI0035687108
MNLECPFQGPITRVEYKRVFGLKELNPQSLHPALKGEAFERKMYLSKDETEKLVRLLYA